MARITANRGAASVDAAGRGGRVAAVGGATVTVAARSATVGASGRGGAVRGVDRRSNIERIVKFGPNLDAQFPDPIDLGTF